MEYLLTLSLVQMWFVVWAILWIIEMAKPKMVAMCLAIGATCAMLTVWFHASIAIQLGVFVIASAVVLFLFRKKLGTNIWSMSDKKRKIIMWVLIVLAAATLLLNLKMIPQTIDTWFE